MEDLFRLNSNCARGKSNQPKVSVPPLRGRIGGGWKSAVLTYQDRLLNPTMSESILSSRSFLCCPRHSMG